MTYHVSRIQFQDTVYDDPQGQPSYVAITRDDELVCLVCPYEGSTPADLEYARQLALRLELTHGVPTDVLEALAERKFTQYERNRMLEALRSFVSLALRTSRVPTRHLRPGEELPAGAGRRRPVLPSFDVEEEGQEL